MPGDVPASATPKSLALYLSALYGEAKLLLMGFIAGWLVGTGGAHAPEPKPPTPPAPATCSCCTCPQPSPDPMPVPKPPAPSPAMTGPYTVLFVTDATSMTPLTADQTALKNSPTIRGSLKSMATGNGWLAIDVSSPVIAKWVTKIRATGTPCLLVIGATSSELVFNPASESSVISEIMRLSSGGVPK